MSKFSVSKSNYKKTLFNNLGDRYKYLEKEECVYTKNIIKRNLDIPILFNDIKEPPSFLDYSLIVYGIAPCGSKTTVIIEGIYPSVDVEYDDSISKKENTERIKKLLSDKALIKKLKNKAPEVKEIKLVKGRKLIGFSTEESNFIRIFFKNLLHRKEFIYNVTKLGIQTFNNDVSSYYRVAARQFKLSLTGWNICSKYRRSGEDGEGIYKSRYVLHVNINDISQGSDLNPKDFGYPSTMTNNVFRKDKSISMAFDIEQYSSDFDINFPNRETRIPQGDVVEDTIFNIGMTFQFINQEGSFLNLSLMTEDCEPREEYITVVCENEKTILLVFSYIIGLMQPEYIYEFNGSGFDWPNIYQKAKILKVIDEMVENMSMKVMTPFELKKESMDKYIYVSDRVKISADMTDQVMANIRLHGYIAFDLRIVFMQLNPTESKSSLKFYLDKYDLPSKDDMPIKKLFKYFYEKDYVGLGDVAQYCYVDCFRLHQLAFKNNIIQDKRAVGLLSYTSLSDAFYRANSSKVRNLIVAEALDKGLFYNSIKKEVKEEDVMEGKYPGALVLNPKRGLVSPLMNFEEYCKTVLKIEDKDVIEKGQDIINNNYDDIYINCNFDNIKF